MANRNTLRNRRTWAKAARKLMQGNEGINFIRAYSQVRAEAASPVVTKQPKAKQR